MLSIPAIGLLLAVPQARLPDSPTSAAGWKELGVSLLARRNSEGALAAFSKACELDPNDEDACYYLGRQLFSLGRHEEAIAPFEAAVRAAPRQKLTRTHRAAALNMVGQGWAQEGERHFREAIKPNRGPDEVRADAYTDYGAFLFRQGRTGEALATLEQAVKIHPGSARAYTQLGRVLLHLEKPREAAQALEVAVKLDNGQSGARLLLGRAYLMLGRNEEGERQLLLGRQAWDRDNNSSPVK